MPYFKNPWCHNALELESKELSVLKTESLSLVIRRNWILGLILNAGRVFKEQIDF